jgi:hypothetical protein
VGFERIRIRIPQICFEFEYRYGRKKFSLVPVPLIVFVRMIFLKRYDKIKFC